MIANIELVLTKLNLQFSFKDIQKVNLYIERILFFNTKFNLISNSNSCFDVVFNSHILDSLLGLFIIKDINPVEVLDVGSGVGFPGIVLALFDGSRRYYLLERSSKKSAFLKIMKLELDLENVEILEHEIEQEKNKYEFITIRSFRKISEYAKILRNVLKHDGLIVAYKGKFNKIKPEINQIKGLFSKIEVKSSSLRINKESNKERNFLLLYK